MKKIKIGSRIIPNYKMKDLYPGDVLLSTTHKSIVSAAVRSATKSTFSHAAIYWGDLSFLEAISPGICNFWVVGRAVNDKKNVRVLRLKEPYAEGGRIGERAAKAAASYIGREYWLEGAFKTVTGVQSDDPRGRMFCSYLVAQAYSDAGIQICGDIPPKLVTPGDIFKSAMLCDVSDQVLYKIPDILKQDHLVLIDGDNQNTPQIEKIRYLNNILYTIRPVFDRFNLQTPTTLQNAMEIILKIDDSSIADKVDNQIAAILEHENYASAMQKFLLSERHKNREGEERWLRQLPKENLQATIRTHTFTLGKWKRINEERRAALDVLRLLHGNKFPFRVVELQWQHDEVHWRLMEEDILWLAEEVARMQQLLGARRDSG